VEFWKEISHFGRYVPNHDTKCCCTAKEPGVPGTRGIKIGERIGPLLMSKSPFEEGRLLRVSSDSLVYAVTPSMRKSHSKLLENARSMICRRMADAC